jgi:TetR/AcrR family transcriptional repressor of bet genes
MNRIVSEKRSSARLRRREQLIEATIAAIAQRGLSRMTISDVAEIADVSHGLLIFHFESKDRLLAETLRFMSEEHRQIWEDALRQAPPSPAARLDALIQAEFNAENQSPERLAAWCAFWGEAPNRPLYLEQCGSNDRAQIEAFEAACADLAADGGYAMDARRAARVIRLTIEGVWLELMFSAKPYSSNEAMKTVYFCTSALFPKHFSEAGLISR